MLYKSGTVSKILGISKETLRYYEKKGIVVPVYDKNSGYRYYNSIQVNNLMLCKMYRQIGFNSEQIVELLGSETIAQKILFFRQQKEVLEKEILWKQQVLNALDGLVYQYAEFEERVGQFWIEEQPRMLIVQNQMDTVFSDQSDLTKVIHQWLNAYPIVYHLSFYTLNSDLNGLNHSTFGFCCPEQEAVIMGLDKLKYSVWQNPANFLCSTVKVDCGERVGNKHFEPLFQYIKENNLQISGYVVGKSMTIGGSSYNTTCNRLHKIMMEIK